MSFEMEYFFEHAMVDKLGSKVIIGFLLEIVDDHLKVPIVVLGVAYDVHFLIDSYHHHIFLVQIHEIVDRTSNVFVFIFNQYFPFHIQLDVIDIYI